MLKKIFRANKGFSLVELLVAITILGIASATVAHSFITSSRITQKSKTYGEATVAADNIAEAVDAFSIDDFLSGSAGEMLDIDSDTQFFNGYVAPEAYVEGADSNFKKAVYQAAMTDVRSGNTAYDAVVTISNGDSTEDETSDAYGIYVLNNYEIAQFTEMDGSFTQSWQENQNPVTLAEKAFLEEANLNDGITTYNGTTKLPAKNRVISINVYKDLTGRIHMDVVYNFTWTYATTDGETKEFTYDWTSAVTFKDGTTAYMPEDENDEPTVFFMYYPDYDQKKYTLSGQAVGKRMSRYEIGTPTEVPGFDSSYYDLATNKVNNVDYNSTTKDYKGSDLIVINNLGNIPTKFFIVKQRIVKTLADGTTRPYTNAELLPHEQATYLAYVVENLTDEDLLYDKTKNTVYTNIGVSLRDGNLAPWQRFFGRKVNVNSGYIQIQGYEDKAYDPAAYDPDDPSTWDKNYMNKNLVNVERKPRYYSVTIEIYPAGTVETAAHTEGGEETGQYDIDVNGATPIYSFSGSKLQ
ncbi:MAG: prepilin-type N-terminal cleavage/methylation domain-containing protein [Clostridia bacterium]|nr:prepilin-type N-terminal cleavage/methylation domain-containing protein [Clostridia bacterium]